MLCRRCRRLAQRVVHEPALHLRAAPPFKTQPHAWRCSSTLAPSAQPRSLADWANVYATLSKFKLSGFVVSTACAGFALGSGDNIAWDGLAWTAAGTWGAAACANTLNQVIETENDARMKRTLRRPLPAGLLSRRHALVFAAGSGLAGVLSLYFQVNPTTAALGAANIALYAGLYTPLKQLSVANTWVGAVVGAIPPLMGWAAATGGLQPGAGVLAGLLYFWQLPHFMALAFLHRVDYAAGGYRMLPIVDPTGRRTAGVALRNALYMVPLGYLACALGVTTPPFAIEAATLSGGLAAAAAVFLASPTQGTARRLFLLSLVHLPLLQAACVVHRVPNTEEARAEAPASMQEWMMRHRNRAALEAEQRKERTLTAVQAGGLTTLSVAPFPFLAPPACPAKAACEERVP